VTPWTSLVDGRGEFSDGPRIVAGSEQDDGSRSRAHLFATAHAGDEARTIATIARRYGQYRRFALWQPRTMRFSVRIDSPMPESAGRDRCVTIMESGTLRGTGGMGDTAWAIRGYAGEVQGVRAGNWTFFDAADGLKHVDSTMPIVAGRTYRFMLSAWPSRNTWDVEVSDGKRTVRASHLLGRGLASRCEQGAGIGYLHFCARLGPKDSPLSFAVEDVSVGPLVEKTGSID
jgi:hypothetical protein